MQDFTTRKMLNQISLIGKKKGVVIIQTIPKFPKGELYRVRSSKKFARGKSFADPQQALIHGKNLIKDLF